jgi:hypothetical protein
LLWSIQPKNVYGSVSDPDPNSNESTDPDPNTSRPKLSPKREKLRNFMFKELGWKLLLQFECPLYGFKNYRTFLFKNLGLDPDPDSTTAWIRIRQKVWIKI